MTREEAIKYFECGIKTNLHLKEKDKYAVEIANENIEAYSMAISALFENKCFEGMTNGEVLQTIISGLEPIVLSNETGAIYFDWDWWNAPYKAESEDKE